MLALAACFLTSVAVRAQDPGRQAVVLDTLDLYHETPTLHLDLLIADTESADSIRRLLRSMAAQLAPEDSTQQVDLFVTRLAFQVHSRTHPRQRELRRGEVDRLYRIGYAASLNWFKRTEPRPRIVWQERFRALPAEIIE